MPRVVVPIVLLCLLVSACCSWPKVECGKATKITAAQHLNVIERLVASEKDATLRQSILDAVYRCRKDGHVVNLELKQHCAAVANAAAHALIKQNQKCLAAMHHGTKGLATTPPTADETKTYIKTLHDVSVDRDWVLYPDPEVLRVLNYLTALITLALPEATADPNSDAAKVLAKALECLRHKKEYEGGPTVGPHFAHVANAYNVMSSFPPEAAIDWDLVFRELDHMVSTP